MKKILVNDYCLKYNNKIFQMLDFIEVDGEDCYYVDSSTIEKLRSDFFTYLDENEEIYRDCRKKAFNDLNVNDLERQDFFEIEGNEAIVDILAEDYYSDFINEKFDLNFRHYVDELAVIDCDIVDWRK